MIQTRAPGAVAGKQAAEREELTGERRSTILPGSSTEGTVSRKPSRCIGALAIDEGSYGPDHPKVANDLWNLAELLFVTNRLVEAEPLYRRALAIDEASHGPDHADTLARKRGLLVLAELNNSTREPKSLITPGGVGRNQPCPCGSGKKYKRCHGSPA